MRTTTIPSPGLGTYRLQGETLKNAIRTALELGYRHIDTAAMYDNEADVGAAIAASGVPREDIFLTTKVWHDSLAPDALKASVDASLSKLQTDHVDLLLIHWPSPGDAVPMADYLTALREMQQAGRTTHIGVSNFTRGHIDRAVDILGPNALLTNQIEIHPFLQNRPLVDHCRRHGIIPTAYMPLAVGRVTEDPVLQRIAANHDATPAQITLAWLAARDIPTFPSSTKREHLQSNLDAFRITLSDDELEAIRGLDRGERIANPDFAPVWD